MSSEMEAKKGVAPIVGWTDSSPIDSQCEKSSVDNGDIHIVTDSKASSGIGPDSPDLSTSVSVTSYSPAMSSIEDDLYILSTNPSDNDAFKTESSKDKLSPESNTKLYYESEVPKEIEAAREKRGVITVNPVCDGGVTFVGLDDNDSICSSMSDEESEDEEEKPMIPDGGWGWVVVLASLIISMVADGISFSFGLLYIEFLDNFGESKSKTAWIGSLFMAVPLLSGPVMSALVDRYGCRKMTMLGGLISGIGFVLASMSNSIEMLYLTFGTIAGIGLGLCYVTAVVSIAYWFDKKRTLAVGLGACGTGVGTFVYAPMTQYFIAEYGWRGTVLLLAGTFLNMCVCGAVMRDPEWWILEQKKQQSLNRAKRASSSVSISARSGGAESMFPGLQSIRDLMKSGETPEYILTTLVTSIAVAEKLESITEHNAAPPHKVNSVINLPTFLKQSEKVPIEVLEALNANKRLRITLENYPSLLTFRSTSEHMLSIDNSETNEKPVTMSMKLKAMRKVKSEDKKDSPEEKDGAQETLLPKVVRRPTIVKQRSKNSDPTNKMERHEWLKKRFSVGQHYFKDVKLHRDSMMHRVAPLKMSKYRTRASSCPDIHSSTIVVPNIQEEKWYSEHLEMLKSIFDFSMFLEFHFLLMSLGTIVLFVWFIVPYFYLAEHMTRHHYSEDDAAFLLSIIGITNTIGMVGLGWAGDQPWMNVTKSYAVCLVLCGLATAAFPLLTHSYTLLAVTSAFFGLFFASSFSFTPVILVELIPLERFTTAYGLILMCQGIGNLIGPPIAGLIFDVTGSWDISFYMAGLWIMISGVLVGAIPLTRNFRIWGTAPLEKDAERISQLSQLSHKDGISVA